MTCCAVQSSDVPEYVGSSSSSSVKICVAQQEKYNASSRGCKSEDHGNVITRKIARQSAVSAKLLVDLRANCNNQNSFCISIKVISSFPGDST